MTLKSHESKFTEKTFKGGTSVFHNSTYYPIDLDTEHAHLWTLSDEFIVPDKGPHQLERVQFTSTYPDSHNARRRFMYWAAKGKHPFLLAVFYAVRDNYEYSRHRILAFGTSDRASYYRGQHRMVQQHVLTEMMGEWPMAQV